MMRHLQVPVGESSSVELLDDDGEELTPIRTQKRGYVHASLRAGGCTYVYRETRSIDTTLWIMRLESRKTLEHYLQEYHAQSSLASLPDSVRHNLLYLASCATPLIREATVLLSLNVAPSLWASILRQMKW